MLKSCFSAKYSHCWEHSGGTSDLKQNIQNCEKCVEFTNNLTKYAILKKDLNNNLKHRQQIIQGNVVTMKKPEKSISNIINFFNSLKSQKMSWSAAKYFKLTCCDVEYTVGENFIDILETFVFGEDSKCDIGIFSEAFKKEKSRVNKRWPQLPEPLQLSPIVQQKPPRKGTLKHRRWKLNKLQPDENYEDDLFDSAHLSNSIELCESDSDSCDKYKNAPTPKMNFSLSPRESAESSEYEDCYSPKELQITRKVSEEYQFRLKQKRKKPLKVERHSPYSCASKVDPTKTLQTAAKILEEMESIKEDSDVESSCSSDCSDLC